MPKDQQPRIRVGRSFEIEWGYCNSEPACYVYKVIGLDGRTIYVGITGWFPGRWTSHKRTSAWADLDNISSVILRGYESRRDARLTEALLIDMHQPLWNTKPERKYLGFVRREGMPWNVMAAKLRPIGRA